MATQASINIAQQMYVAYYGRPADPGGLAYWASVFDASNDLSTALAQFGDSPEFTSRFGGLSASDLISNLYQQMYGHEPDPGGLAFYLNRLDTGEATLASIAKQIADGSLDADLVTLNNRIAVANTFTNEVEARGATYNEANIPDAQQLLAGVDDTQASLTAGNASAVDRVSQFPGGDDVPSGLFDMVFSYGTDQNDNYVLSASQGDSVYTALTFAGDDVMDVNNGRFALFGGEGSDTYRLGNSGGYAVSDAGGDNDTVYIDAYFDDIYVSTINDGTVLIIESEEDDLYIFPDWQGSQSRIENWGLRDGNYSYSEIVQLVSQYSLGDQPDSGALFYDIPTQAVDPHLDLFEQLASLSSQEATALLNGEELFGSNALIDLFGIS